MSAFCAGCGCFCQQTTWVLLPVSTMSGYILCCARQSGCGGRGVPAEVPRGARQTLPLVLQASLVWGSVGSIGAKLGHHGSCQMRCIQSCFKSHISTSEYLGYTQMKFFLFVFFYYNLISRNVNGHPFHSYIFHSSYATCRAEWMWRAGSWLPNYRLLAVESRSTRDAAGWAWIWLVLPSGTRQGQGGAFGTVVTLWEFKKWQCAIAKINSKLI